MGVTFTIMRIKRENIGDIILIRAKQHISSSKPVKEVKLI